MVFILYCKFHVGKRLDFFLLEYIVVFYVGGKNKCLILSAV